MYFRQFPHTLMQPSLALIQHTSLPYTMVLNKYQKGDFTSSNVTFIKNHFLIVQIPLQIYQVILIYGDIFRFIFRQLEMIFFIKLWWQKKKIFFQMHNTIFQRVK